jgi:hypothetical protein
MSNEQFSRWILFNLKNFNVMKKMMIFGMLILLNFSLQAQDESPKFTVDISMDSILMGNHFEVKYTLENGSVDNFDAPNFENFNVVGGPNTSTSMSFMNGAMSQSISYTYYLEPKDIGSFYIQPASVETKGEILETMPMEVLVVPNPDGITQTPKQRNNPQNSFFNDFWDMQQPNFERIFPEEMMPKIMPPQKEEPKKKKRKTVKI